MTLFTACLLLASFEAQAGIQEDIQILINNKDYSTALNLAERELKTKANKNNQKLMFLKGLTLVQMGDLEAAVTYYKKLKRSIKNKPGPANNLAMVYRLQGKYKAAIKEFEKVIKAYPNYAHAYGNLGDTYILMAKNQYQRGVENTKNAVLQHKVNLSQNFHSMATRPGNKQKPTAQRQAARAHANPRQAVLERLQTWVNAWKNQNSTHYLTNYSTTFRPNNGEEINAWVARRKSDLTSADFIRIALTDINIKLESSNVATTTFNQQFENNLYSLVTEKTLKLHKINNKWLIVSEVAIKN